ncbi:VWA domain-containing protein [bacterium]|nr:VWA domain-containing protein [bacterium]
MSEFRFAYPLVLVLLTLPLLVAVLPRLRGLRSSPATLIYSDIRLLGSMSTGWRVRLRDLPDAMRWLAWLLLVVGLARPQTGFAREVLRGQGVDIVLAFDISDSMAAPDFEPGNRLEAAKRVMAEFIAARPFDRIGLVGFAVDAYHQAPLTLDSQVLNLLLEEVQLASDIPEIDGGATALGLGIASAANMLRESDAISRVHHLTHGWR